MVLVVVPAVGELFLEALADEEAVVGVDGQVAGVEKGVEVRAEQQAIADYQGFLFSLHIRTLVAQAEVITPLVDLTHFAELAG